MTAARNVLVTGGSRGIGRETTLAFARGGDTVWFTYATGAEAARKTVAELAADGIEVIAFPFRQGDWDSHERLLAELPDALDRLAVSAAAGRSSGASLAELAAGGAGPLATEMAIAVAELSAGRSQELALGSLRARVGGAQIAGLVGAIERSRRYGSPLAEQLRRQASSLRVDQRRAVQDRAARAAPKIQLVVALVLVPSVLLIIAAGLIANSDVLLDAY